MDAQQNGITQLLARFGKGDRAAESELVPVTFKKLRRLADRYMRSERPDHTLQPTALVHEAYLRLVRIEGMDWKNQGHFFGVAARLMRQVLVDHARNHKAAKHNHVKISLDEELVYSGNKSSDMLVLDEALSRLAETDPRLSQVVELKFFAGLTFKQIGHLLGLSERTAKREWQVARAWLHGEISK